MSITRRNWPIIAAALAVPLPALVTFTAAHGEESADHYFTYHKPDVLGTSLDLTLIAPTQADADACNQTIMAEVERLRVILSTYDPQSEICKLQAGAPANSIRISEDLHTVLLDYQIWHTKSGGAYSAQLGELLDFWKAAEKKGTIPADAELAPLLARLKQSAYVTGMSGNEMRKINSSPLNIDSLGKGYIVQKAAGVARVKHPTVSGILLNIGGDITAMGFESPPSVKPPKPWDIGVADPKQAADNAPPLTTLHLSNKAVATSGTYERFFTFGDKKLSHILNPLTGRPSTNDVLSATVVAADNATANALATILCVVAPAEGIKMVERTDGAAALLVMADGKQIRSKGMAALESDGLAVAATPEKPTGGVAGKPDPAKPAGDPWPRGFSLGIDLTLLPFKGQVPYTAVWIEDANGQCVKVLAAWVGKPAISWLSTKLLQQSSKIPDFATVTKPTRRPGEYGLVWDGTLLDKSPATTGNYVVCIEVSYEHAARQVQKLPITCGATKFNDAIPASSDWNKIPVIYGPGLGKGSN